MCRYDFLCKFASIIMKKLFTLIFVIALSINMMAQCPLPTAVDFTATDCHGTEVNLFDILDGGQYVLIDFFFTTCGSCIQTISNMVESYHSFGCNQYDVFYIEISDRDSNEACRNWTSEYGVEYPTISGADGGASICNTYRIMSFPTIILIAPNRDIVIHDLNDISDAQAIITQLEEYGIHQYECMQDVDETFTDDIALYPNPVDNFLKIDCDSFDNVVIFNVMGRKIDEIEANNKEITVNTSNYQNGIYFVKIGDKIQRFVVTH